MSKVTKNISKKLLAFGYVWLGFPAIFLIYSALIFQVDLGGVAKIFLSPSFWVMSTIAIFTGYAIKTVQWYAWHLFVGTNAFLTYEVAVVLLYFSEAKYKFALFLCTLGIQGIIIYLVKNEIRVPYFSPSIRWWESDPRYKLNIKTNLRRMAKGSVVASNEIENVEIVDISRGGCFLKTNTPYEIDSQIQLEFELFEKQIKSQGIVVWSTDSTITHPKGVGVRFINLDKPTLAILKKSSHRLKQMAQTYTQLVRAKNWQEYLEREKQFQARKNKDRK
jgi:Tfp pilus assembly protein PilZ